MVFLFSTYEWMAFHLPPFFLRWFYNFTIFDQNHLWPCALKVSFLMFHKMVDSISSLHRDMFCKWLYKYGRRGKTVKYKRVLHEKRAKTAVVNSVWLTCTTFFFYKFYSIDFFSFQLKRQHQKRQTCFSIWKKSMVWFDDKRFQRQRTNGKK